MAVAKSKSQPEFAESLRYAVMEMGLLAEEMLAQAVDALQRQDVPLARQVIERDDHVDKLDIKLENRCVEAMAKRIESETRLRLIASTPKLGSDIERIADHAVDIARISERMAEQAIYKPLVDIPRLSAIARSMLRVSLDAFLGRDADLARDVIAADDEADRAHAQMRDDLLLVLETDPHSIRQATHLLFVVHTLERICDHCTNIAERTVYIETGRRHTGDKS